MQHLMQHRSILKAVVLAALALTTPPVLADVTVTVLPGLTGENDQNKGFVVNNNRMVGGYALHGIPGQPGLYSEASRGALWSAGTFSVLPGLPNAPTGGFGTGAVFGLNSAGVAVGSSAWRESSPPFPDFRTHAAKWENGVAIDLGKLAGYESNAARAINDAGTIAGGSFTNFDLTSAAFRWTVATGIQQLGIQPTHNSAYASAINSAGRIVGFSGYQDLDYTTEQSPVYWDAGTAPTSLPLVSGFNQGAAVDINNAGTIVGGVASFDITTYETTDAQPFISFGGSSNLLPLPPGAISGNARQINDSGWILGSAFSDLQIPSYGYYPTGGTQVLWIGSDVIDLTALLQPYFPAGSIIMISSLNDLGDLAGTASIPGPNGLSNDIAFIASIPEPTTAGLTLLPIAAGALRRRRR